MVKLPVLIILVNLRTTRIATNSVNIEAVNMGGIVGDTTEGSKSQGVVIYDVYNKGQIGDDTYTYYARHVAGIVGRFKRRCCKKHIIMVKFIMVIQQQVV